jgi:hypothetical protein
MLICSSSMEQNAVINAFANRALVIKGIFKSIAASRIV